MANKYKLVYKDSNKVIKGSLTGIPSEEDTAIVDLKEYAEAGFKKVYEAKAEDVINIKGSETGVVANDDVVIITREELEGKN